MTDKEFSLIDEPWIRVIDSACKVSEVSLTELFVNAHNYKDLCGELPTQDFAVMRLLLAILHTVFSRYSVSGKPSPIKDRGGKAKGTALGRWKKLWEAGKFPAEVIADYLKTQRESFYLFHPERPFYQVAGVADLAKENTDERIKNGTYDAKKFNGVWSKSANKARLFSMVGGADGYYVSYSQAARWLINLNAFDDTSIKDGTGLGWLGHLGLICAKGNNLFETLMLNLVLYNTNSDEAWKDEKPIWENKKTIPSKKIPAEERKIPFPDNLSELYTLRSRRIFLKRSDDRVTGYYVLGGDFISEENAFIEPMTLWRNKDKNTDNKIPRTHDASRQFWRDFSSLVNNGEKERRPVIVSWLVMLKDKNIIGSRPVNMKIASVQYDSNNMSVTNVFSDSLQMHAALISDMNPKWQTAVTDSVEFCDKISQRVWSFAQKVDLAAGGSEKKEKINGTSENSADKAKADFFNRIDAPFREWLCKLNPTVDDKDAKQKEWRGKCVDIARRLGEEIIAQTDSAAIFGRTIRSKDKKGSDQKQIYSAAEAMNEYLKALNKAKNL